MNKIVRGLKFRIQMMHLKVFFFFFFLKVTQLGYTQTFLGNTVQINKSPTYDWSQYSGFCHTCMGPCFMPKLHSQLSGLRRPILTPMHPKISSCMGPLREKKERTTKTMDHVNVSPKSLNTENFNQF